jgi:site-specific DNA recombinase
MPRARNVTIINPIIVRDNSLAAVTSAIQKRVAAYARVSTDTDEQFTSFEAQVDYYTQKIKANPDWNFVEVYTDEGISATNTKKRDGFKRMIADALDGKIDLILTKSVSRFARNTVDTLTHVRKLKEKGVEVYFEKENIYTMDSKGELLITIMSSLAQEESRSISENVSWGKRAKAAEGRVYLPYKRFLGYEKGPDGLPQIVPEQAKLVERIYRMFLEGLMPSTIAKQLTTEGIPTPSGRQRWQPSTVESILTNEKYKGDAILQKTFCADFLTKKMKPNKGELPQYYVESSHPAIIPPETFDVVQNELKRRKEVNYSSKGGCFSSRIVCGECGGYYGPKVWHSTDKYRRVIWQCNHKYEGGKPCTTPHLNEEAIKAAFVGAFNKLIVNKDEVISDYRVIIKQLTDTTALETEAAALKAECEVVVGLIQKTIEENAHTPLDQTEYERRYNELAGRYDALNQKLEDNEIQRLTRRARCEKLTKFIDRLGSSDKLLMKFDEGLWNATVETVMVGLGSLIIFKFRGGMTLKLKI